MKAIFLMQINKLLEKSFNPSSSLRKYYFASFGQDDTSALLLKIKLNSKIFQFLNLCWYFLIVVQWIEFYLVQKSFPVCMFVFTYQHYWICFFLQKRFASSLVFAWWLMQLLWLISCRIQWVELFTFILNRDLSDFFEFLFMVIFVFWLQFQHKVVEHFIKRVILLAEELW